MAVADTIICVDCGGSCQRMPPEPPELGWQTGDVAVYRCRDCSDVWYLEVDEDDLEDEEMHGSSPSPHDGEERGS